MRNKKRIAAVMTAMAICMAGAAAAEQDSLSLPVLMYHDISRNPASWGPYVVSVSELESDLKWLKAHGYETVGVRDLLDWQNGRFAMPEKPCMITFDDGALSVAAYAEPLLEQYGFRGVAAVIGSVCTEFSENGEHDPELSNLSWEAAGEMARRGTIEVICHTWDMHRLSPRRGCSPMKGESNALYQEALRRDLERFLQVSAAHGLPLQPAIAYPYGAYVRATVDMVRELGFSVAFTCDEKVNKLSGAEGEMLRLGRFNRPHGAQAEKIFRIWEENS